MALVRAFTDVETVEMMEGVTLRLVIGPAQGAPVFNLRVFEVQPGAGTPFHSHWWEHEVFILSGRGVIRTTEGDADLKEGMAVFVQREERHQFVNTGTDILRFICLVPQEWMESVKPDGPE